MHTHPQHVHSIRKAQDPTKLATCQSAPVGPAATEASTPSTSFCSNSASPLGTWYGGTQNAMTDGKVAPQMQIALTSCHPDHDCRRTAAKLQPHASQVSASAHCWASNTMSDRQTPTTHRSQRHTQSPAKHHKAPSTSTQRGRARSPTHETKSTSQTQIDEEGQGYAWVEGYAQPWMEPTPSKHFEQNSITWGK